MKILLVEDELLSRRRMERDLKKLGYEVDTAANGRDAWGKFQQQQYPIVVSDWEMPELNGVELVKLIRGLPAQGYVYIILVTSRTSKADLVEGMEAGADDFIAKPFELDELRVRLRAGQRIVEMEHSLARQNNEVEEWKSRVQKELQAAALIQRAFLPSMLPAVTGLQFAWHYQPCDELGGDMLNMVSLGNDHIGFYVLDVSGHGVRAALLSVTLSHVMSSGGGSILRRPQPDGGGCIVPPAEVAAVLNERFAMNDRTEQYLTLFYGILEVPTQELRYVLAGHPGPIYLPSGSEPTQLTGSSPPVGILPESEFAEVRLRLNRGDRLLVYSDGVPDLESIDGSRFGKRRLTETLARSRHLPLQAAVADLVGVLDHWRTTRPVPDDISMVGLQVE